MKRLTDEDIMLAVANGNIDSLSVLFNRYNVKIYNFFYKMLQDKSVSEDLTQDVFVKILSHRSSYKKGNFKAWIYTIARNIFNTYYQNILKDRQNIVQEEIKDIENMSSNEDDIEQLHLALQKLNKEDRELIVMHRFQQMQYSQIADIIGSSENAVKVKTHRAIKKLKDIYFNN